MNRYGLSFFPSFSFQHLNCRTGLEAKIPTANPPCIVPSHSVQSMATKGFDDPWSRRNTPFQDLRCQARKRQGTWKMQEKETGYILFLANTPMEPFLFRQTPCSHCKTKTKNQPSWYVWCIIWSSVTGRPQLIMDHLTTLWSYDRLFQKGLMTPFQNSNIVSPWSHDCILATLQTGLHLWSFTAPPN